VTALWRRCRAARLVAGRQSTSAASFQANVAIALHSDVQALEDRSVDAADFKVSPDASVAGGNLLDAQRQMNLIVFAANRIASLAASSIVTSSGTSSGIW